MAQRVLFLLFLFLLLIAYAQSFNVVVRRARRYSARKHRRRNLMKCEDIRKMLSIETGTCPIVDYDFRNIYNTLDQTLSKYYINNCDVIYIDLIKAFPFTFIFIFGVVFLLLKELFI